MNWRTYNNTVKPRKILSMFIKISQLTSDPHGKDNLPDTLRFLRLKQIQHVGMTNKNGKDTVYVFHTWIVDIVILNGENGVVARCLRLSDVMLKSACLGSYSF